MKLPKVLRACTLLVLICAPRMVYGQAATSPAPAPKPGNQTVVHQNLVSTQPVQPAATPVHAGALKSNDPKKQALTRQLERRRIELQVRREEHTAPVHGASAKKN